MIIYVLMLKAFYGMIVYLICTTKISERKYKALDLKLICTTFLLLTKLNTVRIKQSPFMLMI